MKRERDSQRSKVYAAERASIQGMGRRGMTIEECQEYVNRVTHTKWFVGRWGTGWRVKVKHGRNGGTAYGGSWGYMTLGVWARCEPVILHELAHHIVTDTYGEYVAWHGWQFAETFLALVKHHMGAEAADALKAAYKEHNVKFRKPRKRKPLTEEQKEVLRKRLAVARAAKAAGVHSKEA